MRFPRLTGLKSERNSLEDPYDMEYALDSPEETEQKRRKCELVPMPVHDPIYGRDGPMQQVWKAA